MQGKISPVFQLFDRQFEDAKSSFLNLSKQFRGKKAIELEQQLIFLEIYIDLLSKIYFEEEKLKFQLFAPFKEIFKGLKKVKHLKLIKGQLADLHLKDEVVFNTYAKALESEKIWIYTDVYDQIVSAPLHIWKTLHEEAFQYSKGLKPLMINTATTQIINEELEYFNVDRKDKLDNKALKDIYEGLRVIIALENIRLESGFNPVFVAEVHERMSELQKSLLAWYENHLFMQHLTAFLTDKEKIPKKYLELLSTLQANKKSFTQRVEVQCKNLFERILE